VDANGWPVVAFETEGGTAIHVKRWDGAGWTTLGGPVETAASGLGRPFVAFDASNTAYLAYHRAVSGVVNVVVRRWDGTSWAPLGGSLNRDPTRGGDERPVIAVYAGAPVVARLDANAQGALEVLVSRWSGSAWTQLGGVLNTASTHGHGPHVAADATRLFVAWAEQGTSSAAVYVKRWTGSGWSAVGGSLASPGVTGAGMTWIAIDGTGAPVAAWTEYSTPRWNVRAARWNGSQWSALGGIVNADKSPGVGQEPSLAISAGSTVTIGWWEHAPNFGVHVRRWSGSAWQDVTAGTHGPWFGQVAADPAGGVFLSTHDYDVSTGTPIWSNFVFRTNE
jgi:hypothetical protein